MFRSRHSDRPQRLLSVASAAIAALIVGTFTTSLSATATTGDDLDVRFTGSLVGTTAYTTTEGETVLGTLRRISGTEQQQPGGGVKLSGGTEGIRFAASQFALSGASSTSGFLAELELTPGASQTNLGTIFSAGGNLYVRYANGGLEYGFDSYNGSSWASHRATAPAPSASASHRISLQYVKAGTGAEMHVWVDDVALTSITSDAPAAINEALPNVLGFGNEVHPSGDNRGFVGQLERIRVRSGLTAYDPSAFLLQAPPIARSLMDVAFSGTAASGTYQPASGELLAGGLALRGSASVSGGALRLSARDQAADFTASAPVFDGASLDRAFVVETTFTLASAPADLSTIVAVGGNLSARFRNGGLQYGFSALANGVWQDYFGSAPAPSADKAHVLSLAYVPGPSETKVIAWLDGAELPTVTGPARATRNQTSTTTVTLGNEIAAIGNRGFLGSIDRARFALLEGAFADRAFQYQQRIPPVPCTPLGDLAPANYIQVSSADCPANVLAKAALVRPTTEQVAWQDLGLTAFVHFGINTFYDQEWGHGTEDLSRFLPTGELDVDSWVRALRDTGHRMAILTVKHHDGFVLYPTRYSQYDIAATPWKNGTGDILRDFTTAAHKYGMKVGVYMSPADSHEELSGVFGNGSAKTPRTIPTLVPGDDRAGRDLPSFSYAATDYGTYFLNSLYEVLTEYGTIDEVWFDGSAGNTGKQEFYDYPAFYDLIEKLQPNAVVAVGGRDVRWVGNESGVARQNEWAPMAIVDPADGGKITAPLNTSFENVGNDADLLASVGAGANALHWWPTESDMKLTPGWFAHPSDVPKSPSSLLNSYLSTAGRNSVMLLNTPPTTAGTFAPASIDALRGFDALRRQAFTRDHALGAAVTVGGQDAGSVTDGNGRTSWVSTSNTPSDVLIDLGAPAKVNRVELSEDVLAHGQTVKAFSVDALVNGAWVEVARGGTIGQQRIATFAQQVTAQQFRVSIDDARSVYALSSVRLFETLSSDPGKLTEAHLDCAASDPGDGSAGSPFNSLEQFRDAELAVGARVVLHGGRDCADSDTPFWGYGTAADPIVVTVAGAAPAPKFGDRAASEVFGPLSAQGWELEIARESVDFSVSSLSRCVAGKAYVVTSVTNSETEPISVAVSSRYGTKSFPTVEAGKNVTAATNTRAAATSDGEVTVNATRLSDGITTPQTASFGAVNCG